jgi:hypothetical protein
LRRLEREEKGLDAALSVQTRKGKSNLSVSQDLSAGKLDRWIDQE